jgi:hypothetical protein
MQNVQLVIFLSIFNAPCMRPNIRWDEVKSFWVGTKHIADFFGPHFLFLYSFSIYSVFAALNFLLLDFLCTQWMASPNMSGCLDGVSFSHS